MQTALPKSWMAAPFLARHKFRHKRAHGKIGSVNVEGALKHVAQLRERIGQFNPQNVYNMDETALYYKEVPRSSVCLKEAPALKLNKARIAMVVGANADGSGKLPLFCSASLCIHAGCQRSPPTSSTLELRRDG